MSKEEILKVIMALNGDIEPVADTHKDELVLNNIEKLGDIARSLIIKIADVVENNIDSPYNSVDKVAKKGVRILNEIDYTIHFTLKNIGEE